MGFYALSSRQHNYLWVLESDKEVPNTMETALYLLGHTLPPCSSPPQLGVLTINMNKLLKKPEQSLSGRALVQKST